MTQKPPSQANPTLARAQQIGQPTEDEQLFQRTFSTDASYDFTRSDPWRIMRITGEFVSGFDALSHIGSAIAIFGSARTLAEDPYYEFARETAQLLGQEGFSIITGGGPGIMEAANKGARQAGVHSVGCNIELPFEQHFNPYVTIPINFRYFFVRKTMFMKYAEAFVIFPGGFGTLDELFEALTLIQTGKVRNFPIILFGSTYWKGLIDWVEKTLLAEGKISPEDMQFFMITDSPKQAREWVVDRSQNQAWANGPQPRSAWSELADDPAPFAGPLLNLQGDLG